MIAGSRLRTVVTVLFLSLVVPSGRPLAAEPVGSAAAPSLEPTVVRPGEQVVTVYLRGLPNGGRALAQRADEAPVLMKDPGVGLLEAEFRGAPARFLPLRLVHETAGGTIVLYDGLVVLSDATQETVAFQYQDRQALRIPVAPSASVVVALDQRATWWVAFGWGALAIVWLTLVGGLWVFQRRRAS